MLLAAYKPAMPWPVLTQRRRKVPAYALAAPCPVLTCPPFRRAGIEDCGRAVSYTHLTLPTICSV
eukprot:1075762-Rhodomonas_salina.5